MGFTEDEVVVLGYLLYPYEAELSVEVNDPDLIILRGPFSNSPKPVIRVPTRSDWQGDYQEPRSWGNGIVDLTFDLINACSRKLESVMNPKVAFAYKLLTGLPFRYNIVPSWLRSSFLRLHHVDSNLSRHLANEMARKILVEAFGLLGFRLKRKNPPSFLVTHDVETEKGLGRALSLKGVEDDLDVQSFWFLLSDEYRITRDVARELADGSIIGSHDRKHDGRLICVRGHDELVSRFTASRLRLEGIFERGVECFRSPLLQFSERIVAALSEAGYQFDFSLPCWEPVHPLTMKGFGVELLQAFKIGGVTETPLTLFQDHQLLNVIGMSAHEATRLWIEEAKLIRSFDGDIVLLIHPDYSFSRELQLYRELLASLLEVHIGASRNE